MTIKYHKRDTTEAVDTFMRGPRELNRWSQEWKAFVNEARRLDADKKMGMTPILSGREMNTKRKVPKP